jgi:hypothetical protein
MSVRRMLKIRLIEPIIERIAERVSARLADLLDQRDLSCSRTKNVLDAPESLSRPIARDQDRIKSQANEIESMSYARIIGQLQPPQHPPEAPRRRSELCKQADFSLDAYRFWSHALGLTPTLHRKHWEFFYICQSLHERGLLQRGRTGLGFGVGREPLPALFAFLGCAVIATDQALNHAIEAGWQKTGEHAEGIAALEKSNICDPETFRQLVSFETVDMNDLPAHFQSRFDFCWSACSLEHLGSLQHGLRFIENSVGTLKIGGVAVHTTEFNLSSDVDTLQSRDLSIYRRSDIEAAVEKLQRAGHQVEPLDFNRGTTLIDSYIDLPPYHNQPHLRLRIADYDCTSIGLIITRGR